MRINYLIGILLVLPTLADGASFDCDNALSKVEKLVCSNIELSELDSRLGARYKQALKESPFIPAVRDQQRNWLHGVRDRCSDATCLRTIYAQRIKSFEWITKRSQKDPLCEEFRVHLNQRVNLNLYALEEKETGGVDPNFSIPNINVDGDDINDQLLLFRTGSASLIPPDNSSFSLTLSSTGEEFTIGAQRLSVMKYKSHFYALTSDWLGETGPTQIDIHRLDRRGIKKLCSYECGLPGGTCGY